MEGHFILHCAPTLASIKAGNMFGYKYSSEKELEETVSKWNERFSGTGVCVALLKKTDSKAYVYVYREKLLEASLRLPCIQKFLSKYGYTETSISHAIAHLRDRMAEFGEFPHEIGVFLGYPLEDVVGFIENCGENSICTGCWKVYSNEFTAKRTFEQYRRIRETYLKEWMNGTDILRLISVA